MFDDFMETVMLDKTKERWPEMDIAFLVLEEDTFIVCIDSEGFVDWSSNAEFKGHKDEAAHNNILNQMALLESTPIYALKEKIQQSYKRMLGEAIARSLSGDYKNAATILDEAETFISSRNSELARSWYLCTGGILTLVILVVGFFVWQWREEVRQSVGDTLFWLIIASVAGATGALLSIIMRMGKTNLDCSAGKTLHQIESVSRIVAGMISAVLVSLAVYAEVLFPVFSKHGSASPFLILVALIAGASERWAPSIIESMEKQGVISQEKKK